MKNDTIYIEHILQAIAKIEQYTKKKTKQKFLDDSLVQDGVIRQIEIIGEASKHISNAIKEKTTNIPWRDIAGMRDKLIHDYFGVDVDAVWRTAKRDIPYLKKEIQSLKKEVE
jgi:uncharacterized protein with HEPN domain